MENRNRLLSFIEESRIAATKLDLSNEKAPVYSKEQHERIFDYKKVLDQIENYVQNSKEYESLDMTNFNQTKEDLSKEIKNFYEARLTTYKNNSNIMILDKVFVAENDYLENKNEDKFLSRIEKITNTSKFLDNNKLNALSAYINREYSQKFKHTGERLSDDYTQIHLNESNKTKTEELFAEISVLSDKCNKINQETQQFQQEEKNRKLLQLIDGVNGELISFDYNNNYLHNLSKLAEELNTQRSNGDINLEDAQKQRDQLIWEMKQAKENVLNLKNEILISETIANVNKTKEQLAKFKEIGTNADLWYVYSAFIGSHLDDLQQTTEQMHYLNKDELLKDIANIKQDNSKFGVQMEQNRDKED